MNQQEKHSIFFNKKSFKFDYEGKVFDLSTDTEEDKISWIKALIELQSQISKIKKRNSSILKNSPIELNVDRDRSSTTANTTKKWKANNLDMETRQVNNFFFIFKIFNS